MTVCVVTDDYFWCVMFNQPIRGLQSTSRREPWRVLATRMECALTRKARSGLHATELERLSDLIQKLVCRLTLINNSLLIN